MHVKQAKIHGERELRLYHLAAWRDSTLFAPRERAALAWTEVLTRLPKQGVPDDIDERVRTQLSEKEISDLPFVVQILSRPIFLRSLRVEEYRSASAADREALI